MTSDDKATSDERHRHEYTTAVVHVVSPHSGFVGTGQGMPGQGDNAGESKGDSKDFELLDKVQVMMKLAAISDCSTAVRLNLRGLGHLGTSAAAFGLCEDVRPRPLYISRLS